MKLTLIALATAIACGSAFGQTSTQDTPASETKDPSQEEATGSQLQEVVVTAQKKRQRAQAVPITLQAFTPAALEERKIIDVSSLQSSTPGIVIAKVTGSASSLVAFIRGVGTGNPVPTGDPSVGIYVDGVYMGRQQSANANFFDAERVEVLKGPQGTLYGANSPAGAIKLETTKPKLDGQVSGKGELTVGTYRQMDGGIALNFPVKDNSIAARVVLATQNHDGYQTSVSSGIKADTLNNTLARLHLLTKFNSDWDLLLSGDNALTRLVPGQGVAFTNAALGGTTSNPAQTRNFLSYTNPYEKNDTGGLTANLHGTLGSADFRSISAYRKVRWEKGALDPFGRLGTPGALGHEKLDQSQFTQEFNLGGEWARLSWLVGAFGMAEKVDYLNENITQKTFTTVHQDKTSFGLFTQESYKVTDQWTLTGGFRLTRESKNVTGAGFTASNSTIAAVGIPTGTPDVNYPSTNRSKTWTAPQWRLAADYRIDRDAMVFASAARGFKTGGFNGAAGSAAAFIAEIKPEYATTYELGTKTDWMNRRLRANLTLFKTQYRDMQQSTVSTSVNGATVFSVLTTNASIHGAELELEARPMDELKVYGNATKLSGDVTNNPNLHLRNNPKFQSTVGFQYTGTAREGTYWYGGANLFYTDKYFVDPANSPLVQVKAHEVLGASLGLASADDRWKIELSGQNLTNRYYWNGGFNAFGTVWVAPPRTVSMKLALNY